MHPRLEFVHADENSSLHCKHFSCDLLSEDHAWHYHPEYELTWLLKSSGTRVVGDSLLPYGPGDLVLLGPNLPHCWRNERQCAHDERPELIVLQFRREFLGESLLSLPEASAIARLLDKCQEGLVFAGASAEPAKAILRTLPNEKGAVRLARLIELLAALADSESSALATSAFQALNNIKPVHRGRIERVQEYVRENLKGRISQAEIASRLNLTPAGFSRFFRDMTGRTFVHFVNSMRIDHVCPLLRTSSMTITQIALASGYQNLSNFNRQFHAIKRMSPSDYRQRFGVKGRKLTLPEGAQPSRASAKPDRWASLNR
jgi:AraC-like DNA-binding protein